MLHHPARLKLAMLMAATTNATFNELAKEAALTPGNLQSHLKTLEAAGYIETWRGLVDLKPRMRYHLTPKGATALRTYCEQLTQAVRTIQTLTSSD